MTSNRIPQFIVKLRREASWNQNLSTRSCAENCTPAFGIESYIIYSKESHCTLCNDLIGRSVHILETRVSWGWVRGAIIPSPEHETILPVTSNASDVQQHGMNKCIHSVKDWDLNHNAGVSLS